MGIASRCFRGGWKVQLSVLLHLAPELLQRPCREFQERAISTTFRLPGLQTGNSGHADKGT